MSNLNRRQFMGEASCAAVGSVSVLSTILNLQMANHAAADGLSNNTGRRALVCIFFSGGMDTYNVLVPRDNSPVGTSPYDEYKGARSNLALPHENLLPLNYTDAAGKSYGLHPALQKTQELFNGIGGDSSKRRLSMVANVGTLIERVASKSDYENRAVKLPKALFSHRDQIEQWQTSIPQGPDILSGWGGRAADVLFSTYNTEQTGGYYMPMNFSFSGNTVFQTGIDQDQFAATRDGALGFTESLSNDANPALAKKNAALKTILQNPIEEHYNNLFQRTFANITNNSLERGEEFQSHFEVPGTIDVPDGLGGTNAVDINATLDAAFANLNYPGYYIADNLKAAARTIAVREKLKLCRQTVFLDFGGWDHHSELLVTQDRLLRIFDEAISAYYTALVYLGLEDDVITFSCSDFGRTLRSNGQGTDHAWGGHQMVMGGAVDGGKIVGTYPSVALDGPNDIGRGGRLFPSTSADEYFCELLRWFGVTNGDMDQVLPNIRNFYDPASVANPLGFLA